jgi:hypothetical protein
MATKGHSTTLGYSGIPPTTYTPVAKITDIKPPAPESEDINVSHMESPEQWEEVTAGWADAGEVETTIQYEKAANATIYGLLRQDKTYKITFSDNSTWVFQGFLKKFANEVERKGIVTANISIRISGKPTFTAG